MASYYWIKLYHEILDDPKMGRLSDHLWRRVVEMFLFAGREGGNGELPCVGDMAWTLRTTPEELQADLKELERAGIIRLDEDDDPFVIHFKDRQAPVSDAERKRQQRERARHAQYTGESQPRPAYSHEPVTTRDTELDKSREEKEQESGADAPAADAGTPGNGHPTTFQDWQAYIQDRKGKPGGMQAAVHYMITTLYSGLDPPDFGYIAKTARIVGGFGRLADLLWQHSTRPPTGDLLAYIQGVAKNGNSSGKRERKTQEPAGVTGWVDI